MTYMGVKPMTIMEWNDYLSVPSGYVDIYITDNKGNKIRTRGQYVLSSGVKIVDPQIKLEQGMLPKDELPKLVSQIKHDYNDSEIQDIIERLQDNG